uniref:Uncharacterized protein n=1 Tax=Anopheles merus TaxID=30066 RepID=A0A182VM85_ANOME
MALRPSPLSPTVDDVIPDNRTTSGGQRNGMRHPQKRRKCRLAETVQGVFMDVAIAAHRLNAVISIVVSRGKGAGGGRQGSGVVRWSGVLPPRSDNTASPAMLAPGIRVARGPDWIWHEQASSNRN